MIVDVASEKQAEDIVMIDISEVSSLANYFVILSGGTSGQIRALRDEMVKNLKQEGVLLARSEGLPESGWVILDFGDVVTHIFGPDQRTFYGFDRFWAEANQVVRIP